VRPAGPLVALALPVFDFTDVALRWHHARRAALRAVVVEADGTESEDELLSRALARNADDANRKVFDNSLRLGLGFTRFFEKEFSLGELPSVLEELGVPCLAGAWNPVEDEPAITLERAGCPAGALGRATCDWWREAIDGFVLGITGGIRHARHASIGHGDGRCVDVLYVLPESQLRFGAIPSELHEGLERVRRMAKSFDSSVDVEFLGISEGTLLYQLKRSGCGGDLSMSSVVERDLRRRYPQLGLREISPRSVLADGAAG
jgi:hypothetical protein